MEKEKVDDNIQARPSRSPLPTGLPINWALITGPVPEPVFLPASLLSTQLPPPPQSSDVRTLQTKVKSLTQRRTRGRDSRERLDTEVSVVSSPIVGAISSEVLLRQRPRGKSQGPLLAHSWRSGAAKVLSSSDEEEEVEVQVHLEIHSPPTEAQGAVQAFQVREDTEKNGVSERNEGQVGFATAGQPYELGGGTSLESLLSDNSSSSKDDPSPSSPRPTLSTSPAATSATSTASTTSPNVPSSTSSKPARRWAPPKGFWRVARPETLLLNSIDPNNIPSTLPLKDYTQTEVALAAGPTEKPKPDTGITRSDVGTSVVDEGDAAASEFKHSDSLESYLDRCEQKEADGKGLCSSDSWESMSSQSGGLSADEKLKVKQRAYARLRDRKHDCRRDSDQSAGEESASCYEETTHRVDCEGGAHGGLDNSDFLAQELEPYFRSLLVISDELPLSPRHEQAKLLLERARLKARSNHVKGDRPPSRRSHSDQRPTVKNQSADSPTPTPVQKAVQTEDDLTAQTVSAALLVPDKRDTSPGDQGGQSRRYGCSPTRVRFEDESEKDAESRYLDRVRQRGRPGTPKSKSKASNTDSNSNAPERGRSQRSVSMPPTQKTEDASVSGEPTTTVIKEIIVLVKKCEACGSVVREPQQVSSSLSDPQNATEQQPPSNPEDTRGKPAPHWVTPAKPEASTRPKVTFAGAFVLGESKETSTVWKSSGFGKLRRRSRKGESRLESGNGPYGPSWARRNSNPRNRVNLSRAVSFAAGSPVALEPHLLEASGGLRESSPPPALPIKSALKSSSRSRSAAAGQPTVQFKIGSNQGGEDGGSQHPALLLDSAEARREPLLALTQGTAATSYPVPCIRPSTLRYSPTPPAAEQWDATPDGTAGLGGEAGTGIENRLALRSLALCRAEDLRAELLRAEHLKAEAIWEENCDGSRKLDGRPKLFLRRFFSSIGLNSVGRLVKGGRSSSMEQLSLPSVPRASSASPSPTRRPRPTVRMQRTPSLQTLHTVLPFAQLRKASSVQSLERRTERSTILGEVQIPYGLVFSPDSPQMELHRALSVEDVITSRVARPVGRVTQAFPDGTLLLELVRPPNGPFGFVISRGKGRPDTGVYVEKVGDGSGEGPYIGLLSIGDEILQVNGEAVAGLSLDQVTRLMTRESTASLRIMPTRRNQR